MCLDQLLVHLPELFFQFLGTLLRRHSHHKLKGKQLKNKYLKEKLTSALELLSLFFKKIDSKYIYVNIFSLLICIVFIFFFPESVFAEELEKVSQNRKFPLDLLSDFKSTAETWGPTIQGYSITLFKYLVTIELAWLGIQATLKQYDLKQKLAEFVLLIIYASFMASIVFHSAEWTTALIDSFNSVATKTGAPEAKPLVVFLYGYDIICNLLNNLTITKPHVSLGLVICCIIIAVTFALMTAQIVMVKCESIIVLNAGAILLGFGGSKFTKDYAVNYLKYSLAVAAKLFTLQLLMGMSMDFIVKFTSLNTHSFADIFLVVCSSILILALVKFIPAKVAEIVNVSQVSGGGALTSAMSAIGITTMTAMQMPAQTLGGAVEAKRGMDTLKEAFNMAGSQGATGFGKGMQAFKNLGGAVRDNIGATNMGNLRSTITSHHEAFKMQQPAGPSTNFQLP